MFVTTHALRYRLKLDAFDLLTKAKGWHNDLQRAQGIGVSHTTIGRYRSGEISPGLRFIALATAALNVEIDDLFDRVDEPVPAGERS